jgi:hypothetical protein
MKPLKLILCILFLPYLLLSQNFLSNKKIKLPQELTEASGLFAKSADSLFWLNDSGNAPELYRTNAAGKILATLPIPNSQNRDWEDLTADRQGRIFIGDFGNNANRRQDLCIYIWEAGEGRLDSIHFRYPDQDAFPPASVKEWTFDMEGFFYYQDSLHLFSKDKTREHSFITKHYVLPAKPGTYTASLRRQIELPKRVVTAAAISPDGETVVLLAYRFKMLLGFFPLTPADIFVFQNYAGTDFLAGEMSRVKGVRCLWPTQYEAIDFINPAQVLIGSERTPLYHQKAKRRSIPLIEPEP